jgi:hypothetical protein
MADDMPPIVAPADEATTSLQPLDEWARVRLESVRDFLLLEGGRMMSLPDVSDPQREIISANVDLLDIRIAELVEHIGSLEPSYQRLRLFKCVEDAIGGAFQIATKGESAKAIERAIKEAAQKHKAQTQPGRESLRKKVMSRREEMRPFVQSIVKGLPNAKAGTVATQLRRRQDFRNRFPEHRRTIEMYVAAIMKSGKPE